MNYCNSGLMRYFSRQKNELANKTCRPRSPVNAGDPNNAFGFSEFHNDIRHLNFVNRLIPNLIYPFGGSAGQKRRP